MIVGTPHYMSPEQCRGEELDARSDIYSLGVIIYEMLTGQVPFQARTPVGVVIKHASQQPGPPRTLRPDIPEGIEEVVLRSLRKDPEDRHSSAIELAEEFEGALYAAGIEFKLLRTRMFYRPFAAIAHPPPSSRTQKLSQPGGAFDPIVSGGAAKALASDQFRSDASTDSTLVANSISEQSAAYIPAHPIQPALQNQIFEASSNGSPLLERWISPEHSVFGDLVALAKRYRKVLITIGVVAIALVGAVSAIMMLQGGNKASTPGDTSKTSGPPPGMVLVKGGKFMMGSDDPKGYPNSKPAHLMTVGDFYLDVNEVTNEEYYGFIGRTGIPAPPQWKNGRFKPGTEKLPVFNVSWFDARAYASWAKKRLPTEAEWEYAAHGLENKAHPWGDDWYPSYANLKESGRGNPVEVGSCPSGRSWCGVNDMVGNVAEWVNDEWYPYPGSVGKTDAGLRIYRGGSFNNSKDKLLMTNRSFDSSSQRLPDVGFRCAKDVPK